VAGTWKRGAPGLVSSWRASSHSLRGDEVARRANISRTLLYRIFKNKEDIFTAVFMHWLVVRHPVARAHRAPKGPSRFPGASALNPPNARGIQLY
jgi:hypothetical protein